MMITIFNRKELFRTFDENRQNRIRAQLEKNHIPYDIKVNFSKMSSTLHLGDASSVPSKMIPGKSVQYEYIIYVDKMNYEKALAFLKEKNDNY